MNPTEKKLIQVGSRGSSSSSSSKKCVTDESRFYRLHRVDVVADADTDADADADADIKQRRCNELIYSGFLSLTTMTTASTTTTTTTTLTAATAATSMTTTTAETMTTTIMTTTTTTTTTLMTTTTTLQRKGQNPRNVRPFSKGQIFSKPSGHLKGFLVGGALTHIPPQLLLLQLQLQSGQARR